MITIFRNMFQRICHISIKYCTNSYKNQIKAIKYSEIRSSWMNQCEYFRKWSDWKCKAVELKMPDSMWRWGKLGACASVVKQTLHSICFFSSRVVRAQRAFTDSWCTIAYWNRTASHENQRARWCQGIYTTQNLLVMSIL